MTIESQCQERTENVSSTLQILRDLSLRDFSGDRTT
jgi:hypothetical protein